MNLHRTQDGHEGQNSAVAGNSYWLDLSEARAIDWDAVAARLPYATAMKACLQDPIFHAEGDVWTHTRMVVDALMTSRQQSSISDTDWPALFLAALLHDIAKPETRAEAVDPASGRMRITHQHHARLGAIKAWTFLWREGVPRAIREAVFQLISWHQRVFFAGLSSSVETDIIRFSVVGHWRSLLTLAEADSRGRIGPNLDHTLDTLEKLRRAVASRRCLDAPWPFASDQARVVYCAARGQSPHVNPPAPRGPRVILLSGFIDVGSHAHATANFDDLPVVSHDEAARVLLNAKRSFVWNAPHLSRAMRDKATKLCRAHDAWIEIHTFDPPLLQPTHDGSSGSDGKSDAIIQALREGWEPPARDEAHRIVWHPASDAVDDHAR